MDTPVVSKSLGSRLLGIPKPVIYLALILFTAAPLFTKIPVPNTPNPECQALFEILTKLEPGSTVILQSDWTESTRGENRGQMDAILRILMRRDVKFAVLSAADPQAPTVARNAIMAINEERKAAGERTYSKWKDYVELGYFPNGEGFGKALAADVRKALGDKRDLDDKGVPRPAIESPVLANIKSIGDVKLYLIVTASKSVTIAIERFSDKTNIASAVTGVMGPENLNYYKSGQLKGLSIGLKGVYDLETMMEAEYPGKVNMDKGSKYILTLHFAIGLLILAVIIGNVGLIMEKRSKSA